MLKRLEIAGFKSFAKKTVLDFSSAVTAIVGPNGSGKSNVAEAFRFALGEQSMKSMRGKRAEDLIFSGTHTLPRANRAAVAVVFDNPPAGGHRAFKIDFDEISIAREVFRDGASDYSINGSRVRLRDVEELLSGGNIGETGHHIISQGEADRILIANPRERREMLENALGLTLYEFKKQEALRKLDKTEENIGQVNSLRRELAPHLKFLATQVAKLERADELRKNLIAICQTYFAIEDAYLAREKEKAASAKATAAERLAAVSRELAGIEERATTDAEGGKRLAVVRTLESEIEHAATERAKLARELGRVEGGLAAAKRRSAEVAREPYAKVPREDLATLRDEVEKQSRSATTPDGIAAALAAVRSAVRAFVERFAAPGDDLLADEERAVYALENERTDFLSKDAELAKQEEKAKSSLMRSREALTAHDEAGRELRRRILDFAQGKAKAENEITAFETRGRELTLLAEELERDKAEALSAAGREALSYLPLSSPPAEERKMQEDRKRQQERLKIRLEEAGGAGDDIRREHEEVAKREEFLSRELDDLAKSAAGLRSLVEDLDAELAKNFADGLAKVNASFGEYFALMFGGGGARLTLEEPEVDEVDDLGDAEESNDELPKEKQRPGIEISVHLPRKKVQSIMQLSGGERALTSIALIFAMSQVNPPPFLILDETDAALDEANSRRYGDMLEGLAKKSQLIVITHNRETMSRAGILYGITMGGDGISKLLSVKFDEAVQVAK
ncbi:AAA family ATPase [Candidatus Kaiserbacteria bacterium]|nr:AAA family ATPase [Candidatus Kaiserbacteria bacterium]